jgi:hypothetical protein
LNIAAARERVDANEFCRLTFQLLTPLALKAFYLDPGSYWEGPLGPLAFGLAFLVALAIFVVLVGCLLSLPSFLGRRSDWVL